MLSKSSRSALDLELAAWSEDGTVADIWWRDDDAAHATPALRRLRTLSETVGAGVALACIPDAVEQSLCKLVDAWPLAKVWQHGFGHVNHAPSGEKKAEFGAHRPLSAMVIELNAGRGLLEQMFGLRFTPVLVPPWNRIDSAVACILPEAGLRLLSTFNARTALHPVHGLTVINTHIDVIDWRGTRAFAGEDVTVAALLTHLRGRRLKLLDAHEPTGILTHHLVHDAECWGHLADLFEYLAAHSSVRLLHPDALVVVAEK